MSFINITSIEILNNPSDLSSSLNFKITFECLREIPEEIEWKVIYVGSSKDSYHDQTLDCFCLGPLEYGVMQFDLETNPPDVTKIPKSELLGVSAIIIHVSYRNQEFFRVGYFVYNNYIDQELIENPPDEVILEKVQRNILTDKPRITRYEIKWGDQNEQELPESTQPSSYKDTPVMDFTGNVSEANSNPMFINNNMMQQEGWRLNEYNPFMVTSNENRNEELDFMNLGF